MRTAPGGFHVLPQPLPRTHLYRAVLSALRRPRVSPWGSYSWPHPASKHLGLVLPLTPLILDIPGIFPPLPSLSCLCCPVLPHPSLPTSESTGPCEPSPLGAQLPQTTLPPPPLFLATCLSSKEHYTCNFLHGRFSILPFLDRVTFLLINLWWLCSSLRAKAEVLTVSLCDLPHAPPHTHVAHTRRGAAP